MRGSREIGKGIYRVGVTDPDRKLVEDLTPHPEPVQPAV